MNFNPIPACRAKDTVPLWSLRKFTRQVKFPAGKEKAGPKGSIEVRYKVG